VPAFTFSTLGPNQAVSIFLRLHNNNEIKRNLFEPLFDTRSCTCKHCCQGICSQQIHPPSLRMVSSQQPPLVRLRRLIRHSRLMAPQQPQRQRKPQLLLKQLKTSMSTITEASETVLRCLYKSGSALHLYKLNHTVLMLDQGVK